MPQKHEFNGTFNKAVIMKTVYQSSLVSNLHYKTMDNFSQIHTYTQAYNFWVFEKCAYFTFPY